MKPSTSVVFEGNVGEAVHPSGFAASNYIINSQSYDYEGNWGFCRFTSPDVLGARIGFGIGQFDGSDYGGAITSKSFLLLHLELMLKNGAVLWLPAGHYKADDVNMSRQKLEMRLGEAAREVFDIRGWPEMRWHFQSSDQIAEIDLKVDLTRVLILPDNRMQHNLFGMWLAIGETRGTVRYDGQNHKVTGTIFYDHPRTRCQRHDVAAFGRNLYTPMVLDDGSYLISHYTESLQGQRVDGYSFGIHVDVNGQATWLPETQLLEMNFDAEGKPDFWRLGWNASGCRAEAEVTVRPTSVLKAWGAENVPLSRKENPNIPLVFDCRARFGNSDNGQSLNGSGMAEFIGRATWF